MKKLLHDPVSLVEIKSLKIPKLIGAAFMLLWALSFSTIMTLTKTLSPDVNNLIILFMRYFFGLVFFSPFLLRIGWQGFETSRPIMHLIRVLCVGAAMTCAYYTYRNLPLVLATSIGMTAPLFATLLAVIFLKDSVSPLKWGIIVFGYLGVLVMLRPHEIPIGLGVWIGLLANFCAASAMICVKILSRTESTVTLMVYVNTITTLIAGLFVIGVWEMPSSHDLIVLTVIGALGLFSQYCYVKALKLANPSFLAPFEYTRMCFAVPVGYFVFGETPDFWILAGGLMIIAATYTLTRFELTTVARQEQDEREHQ